MCIRDSVDADLVHGLDHGRVHRAGGRGSRGADLDPVAGKAVQPGGGVGSVVYVLFVGVNLVQDGDELGKVLHGNAADERVAQEVAASQVGIRIIAFTVAAAVGLKPGRDRVVAAGIAQGSAQANLTELMQTAGGSSSSMVSLIALPMVLSGVIGALLTGSMVDQGVSVRLVLVLTVGLMAVGILVLVFISPALSLVIAPISLGLIGFGQQGSYGTGATVIMRTAPPDMLGSVGTIKPVMGQLGYGLGLGAIVPMITIFTASAEASGQSAQEAAYHGFNKGMFIVFIIEFIALVAVWFVLRARKNAQGEVAADPMLPPVDESSERAAAVLAAEAQSELP